MASQDVLPLSVVTVVKDAADALALTAESVAAQDAASVDYLVVDSSTDTDQVHRALNGVPHRYVWTEPRGIYSAMNVGLAHARGRFVHFLNAGDTFCDPSVLGRVIATLNDSDPLWAFGEVEIVQEDGRRTITPHWNYRSERDRGFSRGHFPPHQGTFSRREALLEAGGFDTTYAIAADYAMALHLSLQSDPLYLDLVIATFIEGGASTQNWRASIREFHRARRLILRPTGWQAVRECVDTGRHFVAVTAYRDVWSKVKRS